jgi:hypothetical protein
MPKIYGTPKPKRSFGAVRLFFMRLVWVAACCGVVYAAVWGPWLRVRRVEVRGTHFVSESTIANLVPVGAHIWLLPKDRIVQQALQNPVIQSVAVLRGLPDSVRIVVEEKKPALLWISGGTASVLDADGYAFMQYPENALPGPETPVGKVIQPLRRVYDTTNIAIKPDRPVVSPLFISFVQTTQKEFAKEAPTITIQRFEVATSTLDVTAVATTGMRIDLSVLADPAVQARNLNRLVTISKIPPASHVDLRVDRWAYVQ